MKTLITFLMFSVATLGASFFFELTEPEVEEYRTWNGLFCCPHIIGPP